MNSKFFAIAAVVIILLGAGGYFAFGAKTAPTTTQPDTTATSTPQQVSITGTWECLPHKNTNGPQTMECAFGVKDDQTGNHYGINTSLMSTYPVDFPTGSKVKVDGVLIPAAQNDATQKYDIAGIINATTISKATTSSGKLMSVDVYISQNISTLSPVKATLGGTFYTTSVEAADGKGVVKYEDGHNAYVADFTYTSSDQTGYKINSFAVRP